jgi:hypothetical protein
MKHRVELLVSALCPLILFGACDGRVLNANGPQDAGDSPQAPKTQKTADASVSADTRTAKVDAATAASPDVGKSARADAVVRRDSASTGSPVGAGFPGGFGLGGAGIDGGVCDPSALQGLGNLPGIGGLAGNGSMPDPCALLGGGGIPGLSGGGLPGIGGLAGGTAGGTPGIGSIPGAQNLPTTAGLPGILSAIPGGANVPGLDVVTNMLNPDANP